MKWKYKRLFERLYPLLFSIVLLSIYFFYLENIYGNSIAKDTSNIITITITLSSIFLGFIGVMIGAIISLKFTAAMDILIQYHAIKDLVSYVKWAFYADCLSLVFSIYSLLTTSSDTVFSTTHTYIFLFLIMYMVLSTIRIIQVLFAFIDVKDIKFHGYKNLADKKKYIPKDL